MFGGFGDKIMTNDDNSLLRDCLVAANGPKPVKGDPNVCGACEGARAVLINMGPGRGLEWHTCKSCGGTGWKSQAAIELERFEASILEPKDQALPNGGGK